MAPPSAAPQGRCGRAAVLVEDRSRLGFHCLYFAEEVSALLQGWCSLVLQSSGFLARAELYPSVSVSWKWS